MSQLLVLNVVGLTRDLLTRFPNRAKNLVSMSKEGSTCLLGTVFPAVTCTVQSTFLTGLMPRDHGIVANGWYFRELAEVHFWKQSNALVQGEKIWQTAKKKDADRRFTSAQLFWWYNMYSGNDIAVTPRPAHLADGSLISLTYTDPPELAAQLDTDLGHFPLFDFWGPNAGIGSSVWIQKCTEEVLKRYSPSLTLVYLPHLDYNLQRIGPDDMRIGDDIAAIDRIVGHLAEAAQARGIEVVVLSEYGMSQVTGAVDINRVLRRSGYLRVQQQHTWELLDFAASRAFAVSDHQAAHVYVKDPADVAPVKALLEKTTGIERVLDSKGIAEIGLDHARSGELVAISAANRWFTYYYWDDDSKCPPWAHEVDIHNKPGYDPVELFIDPKATLVMPRIVSRLALRKLGFRATIMDFIPFDASLVKGSHGRLPDKPELGPVLISSSRKASLPEHMPATAIKDYLLGRIFS